MLRILLMVLKNIYRVPYYWVKLCYHASHADQYTDEEQYELLRQIDHSANKAGKVQVKVYGLENIPRENGFIFFPNHQGFYDVLGIIEGCPTPFSVVAKIELANTPFLKQIFACTKSFLIDRDDLRQSAKVISDVSREVKAGRNYLIFAEGTFSKVRNHVREFKGGSFKAATKAACPIVPVALVDCFKPFDTRTIDPVTVQVHFLPPIYFDEYKSMKTAEIAAMVQGQIQAVIDENIR